jgi:hypothetical protein
MAADGILYLFSSNIRPLYEQDVLNVLAAPTGLRYRFRYGRDRISDDVATTWGPSLIGTSCLINFSLQQPNEYQEAVFFPIRLGTVLRAEREAGDLYLLEFAVERAVGLREPRNSAGGGTPPGQAYADEVRAYRDLLADNQIAVPYRSWASLGPDVTRTPNLALDSTGDEGALFNRMARYLAGTLSYQNATFLRVLGLTTGSGKERKDVALDRDLEAFRLRAGQSYRLEAILSQPRERPAAASFQISASADLLRLVGPSRLEMAGRYDIVPVPFIAAGLPSALPRDGTLEIAPEGVVQGAHLVLPIRVEPDTTRNALGVGAAAVGLLVLGLAGIFDDFKVLAAVFVVIGSVLAVGIPVWASGRLPWGN